MSDTPVLFLDKEGRIRRQNAASRAKFGNSIGRRCSDVILARDGRRRAICHSACARSLMQADGQRDEAALWVRGEPVRMICSAMGDSVVVNVLESTHVEYVGEALTPRERQILTLVAEGLTTQRIADKLGITFATVRTHVERVRDKLGVRSRAEAVAVAVKTGQLDMQEFHGQE